MLKHINLTSGGGRYAAPELEPFDFSVEKGFVNSFTLGDPANSDPWKLYDDVYNGYGDGNDEF